MIRKTALGLVSGALLAAAPLLTVFAVNDTLRATVIESVVGELPDIPGCPFHESCVKALRNALQNERLALLMNARLLRPGTTIFQQAETISFANTETLFLLPVGSGILKRKSTVKSGRKSGSRRFPSEEGQLKIAA